MQNKIKYNVLKTVAVGDRIEFENYIKGNCNDHKYLSLWTILDIQGNRTLLLPHGSIGSVKYNETDESVTRETCTLRGYLNGAFLDNCFTEQEKM